MPRNKILRSPRQPHPPCRPPPPESSAVRRAPAFAPGALNRGGPALGASLEQPSLRCSRFVPCDVALTTSHTVSLREFHKTLTCVHDRETCNVAAENVGHNEIIKCLHSTREPSLKESDRILDLVGGGGGERQISETLTNLKRLLTRLIGVATVLAWSGPSRPHVAVRETSRPLLSWTSTKGSRGERGNLPAIASTMPLQIYRI